MRILLINPPWYILQNAKIVQNSTPLGLCYLGAVLETHHHDVRILNADRMEEGYENEWTVEMDSFRSFCKEDLWRHPVWKKILDVIQSLRPQVIGISIRTPAVASSLLLCELIKQIDREILIAVGGPHPTALPQELLASSYIDFVVRGEGEATLAELLGGIAGRVKYSSILGLSYKSNGKIQHNRDRPLLEIDTIPYPAKHLMLDLNLHDQDDFNAILASRGCPYNCIFCATSNVWTKRVRFRKSLDVVKEIEETYKRFNTRFFSFEDDTFTIRRDRCAEICDLIIKYGLQKISGFRWVCNTRPELLNSNLLQRMRDAGCAAVAIGIESGNAEVLKRLKKGYTIEQVKKAAKMIRETGMILSAQFMIGLPFETESDIWDTVRLAEELEPESVMLSVATPLPKTELFYLAKDMGYINNDITWSEVTTKNDGILFNKEYSLEKKVRIIREVTSAFKRIQNKKIDIKIGSRKRYENMYKRKQKEDYPR